MKRITMIVLMFLSVSCTESLIVEELQTNQSNEMEQLRPSTISIENFYIDESEVTSDFREYKFE